MQTTPQQNAKRDLYKQKYDAQLTEFEAKISGFKASAEKATAQAKLDMKPTFDAINEKFEHAKAHAKEMQAMAEDKLDEGEKVAEKAWSDLKAAVEGGLDALKKHLPS
jgi:hypothetical protein